MPKENSHIYFANSLIDEIQDSKIRQLLQKHRTIYSFGAIAPDLFYYSLKKSVSAISDMLHGKAGNPTNEITLAMLRNAHNETDLAFIMGYVTHCVLDMIFHPLVCYLTGNNHGKDKKKRLEAVYGHRWFETWIDIILDHPYHIRHSVKAKVCRNSVFEKIIKADYSLSVFIVRALLQRQVFLNRQLECKTSYYCHNLLYQIGLFPDKTMHPLFYQYVKNHPEERWQYCLEDKIAYQDLITGADQTDSLQDLFQHARIKTLVIITSIYRYYQKQIPAKDLLTIIPSSSLDTGKPETAVDEICYTGQF